MDISTEWSCATAERKNVQMVLISKKYEIWLAAKRRGVASVAVAAPTNSGENAIQNAATLSKSNCTSAGFLATPLAVPTQHIALPLRVHQACRLITSRDYSLLLINVECKEDAKLNNSQRAGDADGHGRES